MCIRDRDAAVWVTDLALLMANALAAALFIRSQRRGRLNLWPVATTIVTLYTFTIRLSDGTWMIFLLAALAMAGCTLALLLTGGERREVSVSYTHLDVYKRQVEWM